MQYENNLKNETSPYLLQHKNNPVNWYSWCDRAFAEAKSKNKPIFLSIGYSTCHWCHVMAHESFENTEVAEILNKYFVSIKVDKEERPDIDSIYMSVCQIFTGGGGWPTSIFMSPDQKPFFAGTYYPKPAFVNLLKQVNDIWQNDKDELIVESNKVIRALNNASNIGESISEGLIEDAIAQFKNSFDKVNGGFGGAPKFPSPHNLMLLLNYYEETKNKQTLEIAEKTLKQMYKGGIFDHIGFGFSRYSTDKYFLAPHFEKMLYDNALLMMCYTKAFEITENRLYKDVAIKTAEYVLRELTNVDGGFFSAQDADSEGVEGKFYVFEYDEIIELLGEKSGQLFNDFYGITKDGNFEGKNIPNLLNNKDCKPLDENYLQKLYEYRLSRTKLHLDDKVLTSWNGLMIGAFSKMYSIFGDAEYLEVAVRACNFIDEKLFDGEMLYVSFRNGNRGAKGFLEDYAFYIFALINMYEASKEEKYLIKAKLLLNKAIYSFYDYENGGFYLYGKDNEHLILRPKETYDGAIPSGNSVMAYNLVKLYQITEDKELENLLQKQLSFMSASAKKYPKGHSFYLLALSMHLNPPPHIVCVLNKKGKKLPELPHNATVKILDGENEEYPLINNRTTYYVCKDKNCMPPTNNSKEVLGVEL